MPACGRFWKSTQCRKVTKQKRLVAFLFVQCYRLNQTRQKEDTDGMEKIV